MYVNDYDDTYVTSWLKEFPGDFNYWVQPYMKSLQILENPDRPISPSSIASVCANDDWGGWKFGPGGLDNPTNLPSIWGYGFNTGYVFCNNKGLTQDVSNTVNGGQTYTLTIGSTVLNATIRGNVHAGVNAGQVTAPANTLFLGSSNGLPLMSIDIDSLRPGGFPGITDTACESAARVRGGVDNGGYCMAYTDGHAKWLKTNTTLVNASSGITATRGGLQPLSIPNPCEWDRAYDGGNDPDGCKEGFPNG